MSLEEIELVHCTGCVLYKLHFGKAGLRGGEGRIKGGGGGPQGAAARNRSNTSAGENQVLEQSLLFQNVPASL